MTVVPPPDYDYNVSKLVAQYKRAVTDIQRELLRMDLTDMSRANQTVTLASIAKILRDLDAESAKWVEDNVPLAASQGVANTLVTLGVAQTVKEAESIVRFNRVNQNMVAAMIADTQSDLLAITQNIDRKTKATIRKVAGDSMRANMAQGINGVTTNTRDIVAGLRSNLGSAVETGIIDARGRRWKPEVYAEMLTRTKLMQTYNEATTNEAVQRAALYAVISSHGARDACRYHEGRIIKLVATAPGNYPTYDELKATGQIWHPNCKHTYSPIRRIDRLPSDVQRKAEEQAEAGARATATGKRNPTNTDVE